MKDVFSNLHGVGVVLSQTRRLNAFQSSQLVIPRRKYGIASPTKAQALYGFYCFACGDVSGHGNTLKQPLSQKLLAKIPGDHQGHMSLLVCTSTRWNKIVGIHMSKESLMELCFSIFQIPPQCRLFGRIPSIILHQNECPSYPTVLWVAQWRLCLQDWKRGVPIFEETLYL